MDSARYIITVAQLPHTRHMHIHTYIDAYIYTHSLSALPTRRYISFVMPSRNKVPARQVSVPGVLVNTNQMDHFKRMDKTALLTVCGAQVRMSLRVGSSHLPGFICHVACSGTDPASHLRWIRRSKSLNSESVSAAHVC